MKHPSDIIRRRINQIARERDIPIKRLSREAGLGDRTLGHFLDGRNQSLTTQSLQSLATYLRLPPSWFLGERNHAGDASDATGSPPTIETLMEVNRRQAQTIVELTQRIEQFAHWTAERVSGHEKKDGPGVTQNRPEREPSKGSNRRTMRAARGTQVS